MRGKNILTLFNIKFIYLSLRRRYIFHFKKRKFYENLKKRKGKCKKCGACCNLTRSFCLFLENNKCNLYKSKIPFMCKIYPIDQKEIDSYGLTDICGYYWEEEKNKN
jgi:hypothetical protein